MTDILTIAASGDAANVIRDMRVRGLWSSYYFVKVILGYKQLSPQFHLPEMEAFVDKWANGATKQAVEWARGFYKTTCFTIGTGIWGVLPHNEEDEEYARANLGIPSHEWQKRMALHDQDATNLLAFEIIDNAKRKIQIIKRHFEENVLFRTCYPEIAYSGSENPWNSESLRVRRVGSRQRDAEGTFDAAGVGNALQSRHYSRVWEDDLVGEKARKSAAVMEDTIGWHGRLAGAFENATEQTRFLISNRWGYADLNSFIRANEPDFVFHTRSAIEIDPESGEDVAVFPEQYTLDALAAIRDSGSMTRYDFSCQYLNSPVLPGEKEVDVAALHKYTVAEDGRIECSCGLKIYASACNRYMHYDPYNAKGAGSTSCPALAVVGAIADHVFLFDYFLAKDSFGKVYDKIFRMNDIWRPKVFTYEDVGHQGLTAYHIKEIAKTTEYKAAHKPFPRIEGVTTGNRSKEVRIREGLFPVIEKKKFACRAKHQAFTNMLDTFPHRQLDHDYDLLDALAQGAALWRPTELEDTRKERNGEEDAYLAKFNEPYGVAGTF